LPQRTGQGDSARIAAQVVSGIGFLGAGAFLKIGNNVKGLTTAATLWFCAGLGLTIGAGMWQISLMALGIIFVALIILDPLEARLFPKERLKNLIIWCTDGFPDRPALDRILKQNGITPQSIDASESHKSKHTRLSLLVRVPLNLNLGALFADIRSTGRVGKIRLFENY
jgi:putative Mg2+ transporter-C (MgtC) family protein